MIHKSTFIIEFFPTLSTCMFNLLLMMMLSSELFLSCSAASSWSASFWTLVLFPFSLIFSFLLILLNRGPCPQALTANDPIVDLYCYKSTLMTILSSGVQLSDVEFCIWYKSWSHGPVEIRPPDHCSLGGELRGQYLIGLQSHSWGQSSFVDLLFDRFGVLHKFIH